MAFNVYTVTWPHDFDGGVARKLDGWWPPELTSREIQPQWSTPTFELDGPFADMQPNDAGIKICSAYMRELIGKNKAASDRIEWLEVLVRRGEEVRSYAIPHLMDELDVIDTKRSVINRATGGVVKAHLRADARRPSGVYVFQFNRPNNAVY